MLKKLFVIAVLTFSGQVLALDAAKEYEIKAAFLFNLGSFITWPDGHFAAPDSLFEICVLGNDPFGERLDVITAGQKISGYPVRIMRVTTNAEVDTCEVLFISDSEQRRVQSIFARLHAKPILLVGDMDNFVIYGGMVQFFPRGNKIRLMLDPQAFNDAGLKASAHLLRIAQRVTGK